MTAPLATVPDPDRARVARNIDKMVAQGASDDEVDEYVQSEGLRPKTQQHQAAPTAPAPATLHADRVKRNIARLRAAGAPREDIERYLRSEGARPVEEATTPAPATESFRGAGAGGDIPEPVHVGKGAGVLRSILSEQTFGLNDEAAGALNTIAHPVASVTDALTGRAPKAYINERDRVRAAQRSFDESNPTLSMGAKVVGMLGPAGVIKGGWKAAAALGAASGFGHAEGDMGEQAKGAASRGIGGAVVNKLFRGLGHVNDKLKVTERIGDLLPGGAKRQAVRAAATLVDPATAATKLAERTALVPGEVALADLAPEPAALGRVLGRSPKAAITGPQTANQRVSAAKLARKMVGKEYDALDRPLPPDPVLDQLLAKAGMELQTPGTTSFAEIHRIRSDLGMLRAKGMAKNDVRELRQGFDQWLKGHVPEVGPVDEKYRILTEQIGGALKSLRETTAGAVAGARRETGSNTRGANRALSVPHMISQLFEPNPAKAAEATEEVLFNPATAVQSLSAISAARQRILQPPMYGDMASRVGAMGVGSALAPQLSSDMPSARAAATQLRSSGADDATLQAQLAAQFTPEVVRFVLATAPKRLPQ